MDDDYAAPQESITFVSLPDDLPHALHHTRDRYHKARLRMYRAQLAAAEIAARECWPTDYFRARQEFREKLLGLFSQECNSWGKRK